MDYAYRIAVEEARVGHDLVTLEVPPPPDDDEEETDEEEEAAREEARLNAEAEAESAALELVLRGEGEGEDTGEGDEAATSGATTDAMAALMNVSRNKSKQYRAPIIGFLITHDPPEVLKKWHQMALPGILEKLKHFNPRWVR